MLGYPGPYDDALIVSALGGRVYQTMRIRGNAWGFLRDPYYRMTAFRMQSSII